MSALTEFARGKPCTVRLPECDGGGETSVAAHYRLAGTCGIAIKPSDAACAIACGVCHDICDGRRRTKLDREFIRHAHAEGVIRTLELLHRAGFRMRKIA